MFASRARIDVHAARRHARARPPAERIMFRWHVELTRVMRRDERASATPQLRRVAAANATGKSIRFFVRAARGSPLALSSGEDSLRPGLSSLVDAGCELSRRRHNFSCGLRGVGYAPRSLARPDCGCRRLGRSLIPSTRRISRVRPPVSRPSRGSRAGRQPASCPAHGITGLDQ